MALETGDVSVKDPPPPPVDAPDTSSPEITTSYPPDPPSAAPSIVASLNVPVTLAGGSYGTVPQADDTANLSTSLGGTDIFTGKPIDIDSVIKDDYSALREKIGSERAANDAYERRQGEYRSVQERLFAAEGHTLDDLKPWNAQEMLRATKHDLWEQFGSPGFIMAMLASSFSAMPMVSALNGGAAAMNAINQGDMDAYNTAFDAWKSNTDLLLKRQKIENDMFAEINDLYTHNQTEWKTKMEMALSRFNDQRKLSLLRMGYDQELFDAMKGQANAAKEIAAVKEEIEKNNIRRMIVNHAITDDNGKIRPEYSQHPERIAEIVGDAERIMTAPKSPEDVPVNATIMQPGFRELPAEEQSKRIGDALRPIYEAKAAGRPIGLTQLEAQNVEKRTQEILQSDAESGGTMTEAQARDQALTEVYRARAAARPSTKGAIDQQVILGRAEQIQKEAAEKGETIEPWKALQQAQAEHKATMSGQLEVTPEGDTKPPPSMSQLEWDSYSDIYRATGVMPSLGLGGAQLKSGLTAHALFRENQAGGDVGTMSARWANNKGLAKSVVQMQANKAAVEAFTRNAELNSGVLLQLARKVDTSGRPVIERWKRWVNGQYKGDPDVMAFNGQVITWRNEIAKIVTSPNLTGQITVHAQQEAANFAGTDWGEPQIKKAVDTFKLDAANRRQSVEEELEKLNYEMAHSLETTPGKEQPKQRLSPQDQKALDWANSHPDDPMAKQIKEHLGQ